MYLFHRQQKKVSAFENNMFVLTNTRFSGRGDASALLLHLTVTARPSVNILPPVNAIRLLKLRSTHTKIRKLL